MKDLGALGNAAQTLSRSRIWTGCGSNSSSCRRSREECQRRMVLTLPRPSGIDTSHKTQAVLWVLCARRRPAGRYEEHQRSDRLPASQERPCRHEHLRSIVFVRHFDTCLGCMACVTACPSGVQYDKLVETTRPHIERRADRTLPLVSSHSGRGRIERGRGRGSSFMARLRPAARRGSAGARASGATPRRGGAPVTRDVTLTKWL